MKKGNLVTLAVLLAMGAYLLYSTLASQKHECEVGIEFREAVIEAAVIRLRPVLMTSFCSAFGAVPLLLSSGAGA